MVNASVGDLIKVKSGEIIAVNQLSTGKFPVYGGNGVNGYTSKYNVKTGTMIIGRVGEKCGNVYITNCDSWVTDNALIVTPLTDFSSAYFKYLLECLDLNKYANRNAQPVISGQIIYSLQVPYTYDTAEQAEIARVLTTFDTHITNLTELIEKKKAIREGALEDLVSGKTRLSGFTGKWETVNFESAIIPKARIGWQGLKSDEYLRKGFCYLIGGTDFYNGTVSLDNIWFVSEERYAMDANIQVEENDVLVTKDGTIGKIALVPHLEKPATLNSGVFVFRTKNGLTRQFLFRVLISSIFKEFIDTLAAGSTIKHLYQKDLKNFSFSMPTDEAEQEAIASVLNTMDYEILSLEEERDKMIKIREGAMDDLLTGKVRLMD